MVCICMAYLATTAAASVSSESLSPVGLTHRRVSEMFRLPVLM